MPIAPTTVDPKDLVVTDTQGGYVPPTMVAPAPAAPQPTGPPNIPNVVVTDTQGGYVPNVGAMINQGAPLNPANATAIVDTPIPSTNTPPTTSPYAGGTTATPTAARAPTQRGPSSGVSPATDQALIRARADQEVDAANDQLSPTTLVLNYLRSKGQDRSSANVRAALEGNARGDFVIPGLNGNRLVNEAPSAATAQDTRPNAPSGGGGGGSSKPSTPASSTSQTTSAAPTPATTTAGGGIDPATIAALIATGGATGLAYNFLRNRGGATPNAGAATGSNVPATRTETPPAETVAEPVGRGTVQNRGRTIDVDPTAIPDQSSRPAISSAIDQAVAEPTPNVQFRGPRNAQTAAEATAQFEAARKAAAAARAARGLNLR